MMKGNIFKSFIFTSSNLKLFLSMSLFEIMLMDINPCFQVLDETQLEFFREAVEELGIPKVLSGKIMITYNV